ncbi:hypothetical protein [Benzoatithermus flavus]|uniref:Entericidin EcnAB n=1 Tax=Benzoatithermus flavus TaxID=3108223 RepID=A0ABU8XUF3_9PROT
MTWMRKLTLALVLATGTMSLAACEQEGPAERAGKAVDDAAGNAGEAIERAGEKIQDETR